MTEQLQAGLVGPLQIVEHQHDRLLLATPSTNSPTTAANSRKRSVSASVAFDGGSSGNPARQLPAPAAPARTVRVDMRDELGFGGVGDVVAERFGEELIRSGEILFAMPEQHARAVGERGAGPPRRRAWSCPDRLRPRRAHTSRPSPVATRFNPSASRRSRSRVRRRRTAGARPDGPATGPTRSASDASSGSHRTSTVVHRVGQSLQRPTRRSARHSCRLRRPAISRTTSAARICPPSHDAHKSRRLDHRVAEIVVILPTDLAAAQPDPQARPSVRGHGCRVRCPAASRPRTTTRPTPTRTPP